MKKYTKPIVKAITIEANELMVGSLNDEVGNGVQLSNGNVFWDDEEEDVKYWDEY